VSRRAGYLLAEALCALALTGVLAVAAAGALTGARRAMASAESRANAVREGREALLVIGALSRDAEGLAIEGDTALTLGVRIAASVVCARSASSLTLPPLAVTAGHPLSWRAQPIEAGDELAVLARDPVSGGVAWWRGAVDSVATTGAAEPCGTSGGWVDPVDAGLPRTRLVTTPAPPTAVDVGAPVRVARPGRLGLYRSGTGDWMLGLRRCAGVPRLCGTVQPVAGPLRTPGAGGLRLRTDSLATTLFVEVRVPGVPDTLKSQVALRAAAP